MENQRDPHFDPQVGDTLTAFFEGTQVYIQVHYNDGEWVGYVKKFGNRDCYMQRTLLSNWRENSHQGRVMSDAEVAEIPVAQ